MSIRFRFLDSIRGRLLLMMLAVVGAAAITGYTSFVYWHVHAQQHRAIEFSRSVADLLAQDFARIVMLDDLGVAADASARLQTFPMVRHVVLYDRERVPRYQYRHADGNGLVVPDPGSLSELSRDARGTMRLLLDAGYDGVDFGTVYLQLQTDSILTILGRDLVPLLVIAAIVMLLSFALAMRFESSFNAPILRLVSFLERVGRASRLDERIETQEDNEFGRLYHEVNAMIERMRVSREALQVAAVAFETPDGMLITDAHQRILQVNRAFCEITGYTPDEVIGETPRILRSGRHEERFYTDMWRLIDAYDRWEGEVWSRRKNGEVFPERLTIQTVRNESGEVRYYVGAVVDLSRQKAAEERVEYLGAYDALTGLANRRQLVERLAEAMKRAAVLKTHGALICIDIADFKIVNSSLGMAAGDVLLIELAKRLRSVLGERCLLARLAADEFVAMREAIGVDAEDAALRSEELVEQALQALEAPYHVVDTTLRCNPFAGVALFSAEVEAETVIQQADVALHQAKASGDGRRWSFFDPLAQQRARRHLELQVQLQHALENDELRLHFQPQVSEGGRVIGAEALIRWRHPVEGMLSPAEFIPVAERSGLIVPVGYWVLQRACRQLAHWGRSEASAGWTMAVNVSPQQFREPAFVARVEATLREHGVDGRRLKIELTEGIMVDKVSETVAKMNALRALGVGISLDDFGTGYSSLRYLKQLPLTQVKIDQSFVRDMLHSANDVAIIRSILSLGETMGLDVIAEGVESEEQYRLLLTLGCRAFQGNYFGEPLGGSRRDRG